MATKPDLDSNKIIDYAAQLKKFFDVEKIDTDLYVSKMLWLPNGARGTFGGQVRKKSRVHYSIIVNCRFS